MKLYSGGLITLTIIISSLTVRDNCPKLKVNVSPNDKIEKYDISGDDDLWTANDFMVYKISNGKFKTKINSLNDYNLHTSFQCKGFNPIKGDTLGILINFPNMKTIKKDTAIIIDEIDIFNGDRKSLKEWNNSIKVKDIALNYHGKCIGNATLNNTFKMQWVNLGINRIPIYMGSIDTIQIIIKSTYSTSLKSTNYSLSEVMLAGIKKY